MTDTSQSQEDYIKVIWELNLKEGEVQRSRIAEYLDVSLPAVTSALKRLEEQDYLEFQENGHVQLTDEGETIAKKLGLRHNLVEKLLVEVVGVEWYNVHEEAERIEHAISENVEEKLLEMFGKNSRCPHGVPVVEESTEERRSRGLRLLRECEENREYRVEIVSERDQEFLHFMNEKGIKPGTVFKVREIGYDGVMDLEVDDHDVHLGETATDRIWVRELS